MPFPSAIVKLSELVADLITGAVVQTAQLGERIILSTDPALSFWNGQATQVTPATVTPNGPNSSLILRSGQDTVHHNQAALILSAGADLGAVNGLAHFLASDVSVDGEVNAGGVLIDGAGGGGRQIRGLDYGHVNQSTNASGQISFTHALGVVPLVVYWWDENSNSPFIGFLVKASLTSTTIVIQARNMTTNAVAGSGQSMQGSWLAIAS